MKCKDCEHFQSYKSAYEDELEPEECGFCKESEIECHVSADEKACSLFKNMVKPFLTGHIKFEKRGNEIVIVPIYKGIELI
jgi:hypothetical protein